MTQWTPYLPPKIDISFFRQLFLVFFFVIPQTPRSISGPLKLIFFFDKLFKKSKKYIIIIITTSWFCVCCFWFGPKLITNLKRRAARPVRSVIASVIYNWALPRLGCTSHCRPRLVILWQQPVRPYQRSSGGLYTSTPGLATQSYIMLA